MSATLRLDRGLALLVREDGRVFDVATRNWTMPLDKRDGEPVGERIDAVGALRWLADERPGMFRVPIGVIGPRDASDAQCALAKELGAGLADLGLPVLCGGRSGVMHAVCEGNASRGGLSIGMLPDADAALANPYARLVIATGIGEARNALIARAALCLVAIGNSFGTLSEVALGRQFGKRVIGLAGAASVDGVLHVEGVPAALAAVAEVALGLDGADQAWG